MGIVESVFRSAAAGGFRIVPGDARQALRMRRFFLAAATSLLLPLVLLASSMLGLVEYAVAGWSAVVMGLHFVLFYCVFRAGLNLRFRDPSLTGEQIFAAILYISCFSYFAGEARPAIAIFYLVALLFGALRLDTVRLIGLAVIALFAQALVVWIWHERHPGANLTASLVDLAALAVVLPWFAGMGGYVNSLRSRLSDSHRQLQSAFDRIEQIAIRDELTGAYNRRFLMETLGRERSRSQRLATGFAVCMLDIDHFKKINDTLGHAAGDTVLSQFAARAKTALRDLDTFGRYGGEEFLVVLPLAETQGAVNCAERIRVGIEGTAFPMLPEGTRITVTAGVTCYRRGEEISALLARADEALYRGKAAGRNCVVAVS